VAITPPVAVTCVVIDVSGSPVPEAAIVFQPNRVSVNGGVVVPVSVSALTDDAGFAVVDLYPNAVLGGSYAVTIEANGIVTRGVAVIPDSDCVLSDVFTAMPYPNQNTLEAILARINDITPESIGAISEAELDAEATARVAHESASNPHSGSASKTELDALTKVFTGTTNPVPGAFPAGSVYIKYVVEE
jgi:hypothetical protein